MMRRRSRSIAATVPVAVSLALSACAEVEPEEHAGYEPAALESLEGREALKRVTLTAEGARRTGLETAPVRRTAGQRAVPYEALIYDPQGTAYVYTSIEPLSFVRAEIVVDRIDGGRVFLSAGPAAGARVVTVGATEVYGAELEIASG